MPTSVSINDASDGQLSVLLGLRPAEIDLVRSLRPIASRADVERRLGHALDRIDDGLQIPKLDVNAGEAASLAAISGIDLGVARRVVASRPIYVALQLRTLEGVDADAFARITAYYAPRALNYVDKLSGLVVDLTPDLSKLLVTLNQTDSESAAEFGARHSLKTTGAITPGRVYQVLEVSQGESHFDTLSELRDDPVVRQVIPAFDRPKSGSVFIDPELCVVQFQSDVDEARQDAIIGSAALDVVERHRTPGLLTVRLDDQVENPTTIMAAIATLNHANEVLFAEPAFIGVNDLDFAALAPTVARNEVETASLPWNLRQIGLVDVASAVGPASDRVVIAVVDTGVDVDHPSLAGAVLDRHDDESWNFADDGNPNPIDTDGHGTFISGLLAGHGFSRVVGACPTCRILPLKVPLGGTSLSYARRRDAILYAVDRVRPPNRLVINLSWKTTGDVGLIRDAVAQAASRGVLIVASAGNWPEAEDQPHFPSDYAEVVSVGAVGPDGRRADYSFYGAAVDLVAPGGRGSSGPTDENLYSARPEGGAGNDFGTSFAAPHVVGAAALILSHQPDLAATHVRSRLESTATTIADAGTGHGLINIPAALGPVCNPLPGNPESGVALEAINTMNGESLSEVFGLASITARIIVAKRPFAAVAEIKDVLGLSDAQYVRIVSYIG